MHESSTTSNLLPTSGSDESSSTDPLMGINVSTKPSGSVSLEYLTSSEIESLARLPSIHSQSDTSAILPLTHSEVNSLITDTSTVSGSASSFEGVISLLSQTRSINSDLSSSALLTDMENIISITAVQNSIMPSSPTVLDFSDFATSFQSHEQSTMISANTTTHVTSTSLETVVSPTILEASMTSYSGSESLSVFDTNFIQNPASIPRHRRKTTRVQFQNPTTLAATL